MAEFEHRQVKAAGGAPCEIVLPYFFGGAAAEPLNAHLARIAQHYGAFFKEKDCRAALRGSVCAAGEALLSFYLDAYAAFKGECISFFRMGEIWDNRRGNFLPYPAGREDGCGFYTDGKTLFYYRNTFSSAVEAHRRRPARSVLVQEEPFSAERLTKRPRLCILKDGNRQTQGAN